MVPPKKMTRGPVVHRIKRKKLRNEAEMKKKGLPKEPERIGF